MVETSDQLTWGTHRVLALAEDAAHRYGRPCLGAEHLLLGVLAHSEGTGARVLHRSGVSLGRVRAAVEMLTQHHAVSDSNHVPLDARAEQVLALAGDEARLLGHNRIGTGHLLLGLVRENAGIPAGILASMGVHDLTQLREYIVEADSPPLL